MTRIDGPDAARTGARWRPRALAGLVAVSLGLAACADGQEGQDGRDDAADVDSAPATSTLTESAGGPAQVADVAAPVPRQEAADPSSSRTITVTGRGSVAVRPDVAEVQIGVRVDGRSAQAVLDEASEGASRLVAELESLGIAEDDIRTTDLSVFPRFGPEGTEVTGYEASNTVNVTIREIDRVGEVIDDAAGAAGDSLTIGGITFSVSDPDAALADARTRAVEDAADRAAQLAEATGATVGEVISLSEGSTPTPGPLVVEEAADAAGVAIEPGSQMISVQVTVVYGLVEG